MWLLHITGQVFVQYSKYQNKIKGIMYFQYLFRNSTELVKAKYNITENKIQHYRMEIIMSPVYSLFPNNV